MSKVFPRVTKCTFQKYGPSGTIQNHDAQVFHPLSIISTLKNEYFVFPLNVLFLLKHYCFILGLSILVCASHQHYQ